VADSPEPAEATAVGAAMLPPNATPLERCLAGATYRVAGLSFDVARAQRPPTSPDALLPWLAWSLAVDIWHEAWSVPVRRFVVQQALARHRRRGTRAAVRDAIRLVLALALDPRRSDLGDLTPLDDTFRITEWFEPGAEAAAPRMSFAVDLLLGSLQGEGILRAHLYQDLRDAIDATKPLSARYALRVSGLSLSRTMPVALAARVAQAARFTADLRSPKPREPST
jgi:P2-related tail formation protein